MDIVQTSNKYLNTLFLKSQNDFENGYSEKLIAKLLMLDRKEAQNVMHYAEGKNWLDTENGFRDNISLSSEGIDYVSELRENKVYKTIKFTGANYLPSSRDAIEFLYYYDIINDDGTSETNTIKVAISGSLCGGWGAQILSSQPDKDYLNLAKILLQFGKDQIVEKLKEGTLNDNEELILLTTTHPSTSPYNPDNLIDIENAEYEVEVGQKLLSEEIKENKLAASIIETRDRINAIFYYKHKEKLLLLNEERNLLDFFKSAKTEEEFSHRLASLGQVSRYMNVSILRKLTNETKKEIGSVTLLENYLESIGKNNKIIIDTLRQIGRVRQGYPMHTDIAGVVQCYEFFNLKYPVENFETTWTELLNNYLAVLKLLFEILTDTYLKKEK